MPSFRTTSTTLIIVGLLLAALLLTAGLTWEAARAESSRRDEIHHAIRGYASVIADDLARRTVFELESLTSYPLRSAALRYYDTHGRFPSVAELRKDDDVADAAMLVDGLFLVDSRKREVSPPAPEPLRTWLLTKLPGIAATRGFSKESQTVRVTFPDGDRIILYGIALLDQGRIFAFTLPERSVGALAARAFGRRSVFPGVLGEGRLTNRDVFIRISRGAQELFRTGGRFEPESGIVMRMAPGYGEAVGGLQLECSLVPSAVPALILGGVPRSKAPLLGAILLSSLAVFAAIFVVLRREHHLAEARSDFVSGVSHELRTPLTQIRMFAETLLYDRARSDDERQRSLAIINEEARRLTNLVENVLFLSRDSNRDAPRDLCDLEIVTGDAIDAFAPLANRRQVSITADLSPHLHAFMDGEEWKQVVTNILDNAVKYGPPGQTVHVIAAARDGMVRMTVDDEGPGIPPSDRESVWRRFHRLRRDRIPQNAGSGIGLAIVRSIVRRHGGRCWVEDAPSGGSRFVVEVRGETKG